jgi:hypothetical protein
MFVPDGGDLCSGRNFPDQRFWRGESAIVELDGPLFDLFFFLTAIQTL